MKLLKPATEWAENAAKTIDINAFSAGDIYHRIYQAWMCIASGIFENMDIPLSASGSIDDIIECLQPRRRRMKVTVDEGCCCIEYCKGSDKAFISGGNGKMMLFFIPYAQTGAECSTYDISCYGPDSVASVIAALFKANRILESRFQSQMYR